MKPICIYELTRAKSQADLSRLERQMSKRTHLLKIKDWEVDGLKKLSSHLCEKMPEAAFFEFFYSFQIPKLGKEFDLLRISEDTVFNIELKSEPVPDERILTQLVQNKYYLSSLGKQIKSYTYISSEDRLVRLSNSGKIVEADWEILQKELSNQSNLYTDDIEDLFKEEHYIISPLEEPDRFLNKEYFLTSQQKDIEKKILKGIKLGQKYFGFTGIPGTGKTLLLYDIAMKLSVTHKVLVLQCGQFSNQMRGLGERLKRIDFLPALEFASIKKPEEYYAVLVDEANLLSQEELNRILDFFGSLAFTGGSVGLGGIPFIFSYDCEEAISLEEYSRECTRSIEKLPEVNIFRLTGRLRANSEISSFIQCIMYALRFNHRRDYPNVTVSYAGDDTELEIIKAKYIKLGFSVLETEKDMAKEYSRVLMVMDENFYYDEKCYLRSRDGLAVRKLFRGLGRAGKAITIIVKNNEDVFDVLLTILQGQVK